MAARRITFVRHAMPKVEAAALPDVWELSPAGVASAAARLLSVVGATPISSPERKARQTTALITGMDEELVVTDARFGEVVRVERVHDGFRPARAAWIAGRLDTRHHGWETPKAAAQRFHEGLLAHRADHLIVGTHGMVLTAWLIAQSQVQHGDAAVAFWDALDFPAVIELTLPLLRVRAMLTDADGRLVLIKRTRPGQRPYWTLPGGGVEPADASPEHALRRELREELGAETVIGDVVHERPLDSIRTEIFYAADLLSFEPPLCEGPELGVPSRGQHQVERVHRSDVASLDLRPAELKDIMHRGAAPRQ